MTFLQQALKQRLGQSPYLILILLQSAV